MALQKVQLQCWYQAVILNGKWRTIWVVASSSERALEYLRKMGPRIIGHQADKYHNPLDNSLSWTKAKGVPSYFTRPGLWMSWPADYHYVGDDEKPRILYVRPRHGVDYEVDR